MTKRTKGKILILALCIVAGIIGIYIKKKVEIQKATHVFTNSAETHFDWFYAYYEGKNGSLAVITKNDINTPASNWMGEGYFYGGKIEYMRVDIYDEFDHMDLQACETYVYDIFEQKIVKTIDFIPILEEYVPGYYYADGKYYVDTGKNFYAVVVVSDYAKEEDRTFKDVCINMETEEVQVLSDGKDLSGIEVENSETDKVWREEFYRGEESIWDLLRENGYTGTWLGTDSVLDKGEYDTVATYKDGTFIIRVPLSSLSMENELLNEYFPELKNYHAEDDDMVTLSLRDILKRKKLLGF